MSAIHEINLADDVWTDVTDRVLLEGWQTKENAEEGSVAVITMTLRDPAMDFEVNGFRRYRIRETASTGDDDVLFHGYVNVQRINRGWDEAGEPFGRVWKLEISDTNAVWAFRVMEGADCSRPAETDVARMQWLLSTAEAISFSDVSSFVYTTNPVAMDKCDYRGQMFNNIADDCALAAGKNWFAFYRKVDDARILTAWYGADDEPGYVSPQSISNDASDWSDDDLADGSSTVWPASDDSELVRDPMRVFSGNHLPYDGGSVYVTKSTTADSFIARDAISPSVNVKSKAKAFARARRQLNDMDEQDLTITTKVEVPREIASQFRAGMALDFRATHFTDGLDEFTTCRILNAAPRPVAAGERYEIPLELGVPRSAPASGSARAILYQVHGGGRTDGTVHFGGSGDDPPSGYPRLAKSALIDYINTGDKWGYTGFTIHGTGTIEVYFNCPAAGVLLGGVTIITWGIALNGGLIASEVLELTNDGLDYFAHTAEVRATIAVVDGDVIGGALYPSRPVAFFGARSIGNSSNRLEITGGSLV